MSYAIQTIKFWLLIKENRKFNWECYIGYDFDNKGDQTRRYRITLDMPFFLKEKQWQLLIMRVDPYLH